MLSTTTLNWSKSKTVSKYILHIFDAPPHGREYAERNGDRYPNGCPCGLQKQQVIDAIRAIGANYIIYPLTERVNKAMDLFAQSGLDFKKYKIDKDKPI